MNLLSSGEKYLEVIDEVMNSIFLFFWQPQQQMPAFSNGLVENCVLGQIAGSKLTLWRNVIVVEHVNAW